MTAYVPQGHPLRDRYPYAEQRIVDEFDLLRIQLRCLGKWREFRRMWKDARNAALQNDTSSF